MAYPSSDLTDDDLTTLVEALEAWESKDTAGEMFGDMIAMMFTKDDPVQKAKFESELSADRVKRDRAKAIRKERSIILRAKLLFLRNSRRVDDVTAKVFDRP